MRALVLGSAHDATAAALSAGLRAQRGVEVRCADLATLARARWQHRLDARGAVRTDIDFGAGIEPGFDVVCNRIDDPALLPFHGWTGADRDYGRTEWLALLLSWLSSLGDRVVNRPCMGSLHGPDDGPWRWLARAARAGFALHPMGATTSTRTFPAPRPAVDHAPLLRCCTDAASAAPARAWARPACAVQHAVVVGERVFGLPAPSDAALHAACLRLARQLGVDVLGLQLAQSAGDPAWRFVSAQAAPQLDDGAESAALAALVQLVLARGRR